jgi:hypothetical protein
VRTDTFPGSVAVDARLVFGAETVAGDEVVDRLSAGRRQAVPHGHLLEVATMPGDQVDFLVRGLVSSRPVITDP